LLLPRNKKRSEAFEIDGPNENCDIKIPTKLSSHPDLDVWTGKSTKDFEEQKSKQTNLKICSNLTTTDSNLLQALPTSAETRHKIKQTKVWRIADAARLDELRRVFARLIQAGQLELNALSIGAPTENYECQT
jgi:hypothetical protein